CCPPPAAAAASRPKVTNGAIRLSECSAFIVRPPGRITNGPRMPEVVRLDPSYSRTRPSLKTIRPGQGRDDRSVELPAWVAMTGPGRVEGGPRPGWLEGGGACPGLRNGRTRRGLSGRPITP